MKTIRISIHSDLRNHEFQEVWEYDSITNWLGLTVQRKIYQCRMKAAWILVMRGVSKRSQIEQWIVSRLALWDILTAVIQVEKIIG